MKISLILIFLLQASILSQIPDTSISVNVRQLFDIADSTVEVYKSDRNNFLSKYNSSQINYLIKKYYDAIAKAPFDYQNFLEKEFKQWGIKYKNGDANHFKPAFRIDLIKRLISKNKGEHFTKIIGIPYYIKVKILKITHDKYISFSPAGLEVAKTILLCKIEDVIKGREYFKNIDTVEINLLDFWIEKSNENFIEGHEYFVPLKPFNCRNGNCEGIGLAPWLFDPKQDRYPPIQGNYGVYPIEAGVIQMKDNYFGFGRTVSWDIFKKLFTEKFIIK